MRHENPGDSSGQAFGPLSSAEVIQDQLADFAISHCAAIRFGRRLGDDTFQVLSSGSGTLLVLDHRPLIITSDHVVRAYEDERNADHFQAGRAAFDLSSRIVDRDRAIDLCVLDAGGLEINDRLPRDPVPATTFYTPSQWPPEPLRGGETLFWVGFPSSLRHRERGEQFTVPLSFFNAKLARVEGRFLVVNLDPSRAEFKLRH